METGQKLLRKRRWNKDLVKCLWLARGCWVTPSQCRGRQEAELAAGTVPALCLSILSPSWDELRELQTQHFPPQPPSESVQSPQSCIAAAHEVQHIKPLMCHCRQVFSLSPKMFYLLSSSQCWECFFTSHRKAADPQLVLSEGHCVKQQCWLTKGKQFCVKVL